MRPGGAALWPGYPVGETCGSRLGCVSSSPSPVCSRSGGQQRQFCIRSGGRKRSYSLTDFSTQRSRPGVTHVKIPLLGTAAPPAVPPPMGPLSLSRAQCASKPYNTVPSFSGRTIKAGGAEKRRREASSSSGNLTCPHPILHTLPSAGPVYPAPTAKLSL